MKPSRTTTEGEEISLVSLPECRVVAQSRPHYPPHRRARCVKIPRLWRKNIGTAVFPAASMAEVETSEVNPGGEAAPVMAAVPHAPDEAWAGRGSGDAKNGHR